MNDKSIDELVLDLNELGYGVVDQWGLRPPTGLIEVAARWLRSSYQLNDVEADPALNVELVTLTRVIETLVENQARREA